MSKPVVLKAKKNCRICGGSGTFHERHEQNLSETFDCDCAFEDIPDIFEIQNKVENGNYVIVPAE